MRVKNFASILNVALLSGCALLNPGVDEPEWAPPMLQYSVENGCEFVDDVGNSIGCGSEDLFNYTLIPSDSLIDLDVKLTRCEKWR